jgi:hypothetical protein
MGNELQKQLDENKFFTVRFGGYLIVISIMIIFYLLYYFKVDGESIISIVVSYYFE